MFLYSFTLQKPTAIVQAVYGNFSATKAQELVINRGRILDLARVDESGKLQTVASVDVFGIIRSISAFRLPGGGRDYVLVGSDSGRIVILEFNNDKNRFERVHQETFGRSGCRRIVPGQMIATDPKGRAMMIAAIEKQKFVYILNRDAANKLAISSPLEAHKSHNITFSITGLDVAYDNPVFAAIELDYSEADNDSTGAAINQATKKLAFYELDLGLNNVVRKWSDDIDNSSHLLIAVPGGTEGPGGVLVCSSDTITWRNMNRPQIVAKIPRRQVFGAKQGTMIVSYGTHKQKDLFLVLAQTELGDLFKITLSYKADVVEAVNIKYFDTCPVATSLCVFKTGFLFAAAEAGNHMLYQFQSLGDDDEDRTYRVPNDPDVYFKPRALQNLVLIDEVQNIGPITDAKVLNLLREETPQIYTLSGRGKHSSMRVLRSGIAPNEIGTTPATLPGTPTAIITVKKNAADPHDKYILVSFANATLVLAIGDTVEEVQDSGFLGTAQTLAAGLVGDDSLVQVHPDGIRHIRADKRIQEWRPPSGKKITHASLNPQQVVIGCPGGEMFYFEIDASGALAEIDKYNLGREIVALEIAPLQAGSIRSQFVAAADPEGRVRLYSLTGQTLTAGITLGNTGGLAAIATQVLPARARSLCMAWTGTSQNTLTLAVGTVNGLLIRATIDSVSGQITDARTRLLGAKPVKLVKTIVKGTSAILALSSRTWVMFTNQGRLQTAPLSYVPVEHASSFSSEQCAEGVVCISRDVVRIFTLDRLEDTFNHSEIPLRYTPRKFEVHPSSNNLIILETDHNAYSHFDRENFKNQLHPEIKVKKEDEMDVDGEQQMPPLPLELDQIIDYRAGKGRWASCLRLFDASQNRTLDLVELEDNEAALCMCLCGFHDREGELFLCVGTVKDLVYEPQRQFSAAFVHVYRVTDQGRRLTLLHKTQVDDMPGAIHGFQGRLLVGAGKALRLYDLGKKRLLKKAENKSFPNQIVSLAVQGSRIIVGDVQDSVLFAKYSKPENSFFIFADDPVPRWMSTFDVLDYDTIVGGDKFGNIFVLRLPDKVGEEVDNDPNGSRFWEIGNMNGAQYKLELVAHYFVGEAVTKVTKTSLTPGGSELILYTTISGTIGALLPFSSREDVDVFSKLEMHLRQENTPLCGRDHLAFRGYYNPVKSVVDGDLCEQFPTLDMDKQRKIAEDFVRTVQEVQKKVEDIRNAV